MEQIMREFDNDDVGIKEFNREREKEWYCVYFKNWKWSVENEGRA